MTTSDEDTLFEFPCSYPIKIMGKNEFDLEKRVLELLMPHLDGESIQIESRLSSGGNYCAITVTFTAKSKAQLDDIYMSLTAEKRFTMVL